MTVLPLRALLAAFAFFSAAPALADSADFSGAWVGWLCPEGIKRESGMCSNFVLELHQRNGRLCGAHTVSTPGANQVDEGAAPSISGQVSGDGADIVVISTMSKTPVQVRALLKKVNGALQWQRLDAAASSHLLPTGARLTKSRKKSLFAPLFEQELQAICLQVFTVAEQAQQPAR